MERQVAPPLKSASIHEGSSPAELVAWSLERFADQRMVITTSFGMEGCALIDMYAAHQQPLTVIYLDTMFFFPETYALRDRLVQRYSHLEFVNRGTDLTPGQQEADHGPELWKRDPDLCCKLRKVDPMRRALAGTSRISSSASDAFDSHNSRQVFPFKSSPSHYILVMALGS